jgi:hypothetical protein
MNASRVRRKAASKRIPRTRRAHSTQEDVPGSRARWIAVWKYALTFDGYTLVGPQVGAIANRARAAYDATGRLPESLRMLRACLFFEQRRAHWLGEETTRATLRYVRLLVRAIRERVN